MDIKEVAKLLGTSALTIRVGLQQGVFPFGVAFKTKPENKVYNYVIYPEKLKEYVNFKEEDNELQVWKQRQKVPSIP